MRYVFLYVGWVFAAFLLGIGVGGFYLHPRLSAPAEREKCASEKLPSRPPKHPSARPQPSASSSIRPQERPTERSRPSPSPLPSSPSPSPVVPPPAASLASTQLTAADLPNVAIDRLPAEKRPLALKLLNELRQPCGCGQSIARCAKTDLSCPSVQRTVEALMEAIHQGRPREEIVSSIEAAARNPESSSSQESQGPKPGILYRVPVEKAPSKGPAHAALTIVVFSDFECPYCSQASGQIDLLIKAYGAAHVRTVYRHLPLPFHPHATPAAIASLAAHRQGKFWEYHDLLFKNQDKLTKADLLRYAREIKLSIEAFQKDLDDPALQQQVQADMKLASELGIPGTPSFFINGYPLGEQENILDVAKRAFQKAEDIRKQGIKPEALYQEIMKQGRTKP